MPQLYTVSSHQMAQLTGTPMQDCALSVYGRVALWGDIIEHELGYRAEFAKVISLDDFIVRTKAGKIDLKELRERYKVAA